MNKEFLAKKKDINELKINKADKADLSILENSIDDLKTKNNEQDERLEALESKPDADTKDTAGVTRFPSSHRLYLIGCPTDVLGDTLSYGSTYTYNGSYISDGKLYINGKEMADAEDIETLKTKNQEQDERITTLEDKTDYDTKDTTGVTRFPSPSTKLYLVGCPTDVFGDALGDTVFSGTTYTYDNSYILNSNLYINGKKIAYDEDKVNKVDGKGLSTNDYTTAEKTKLSGIAVGANKTVVDSELNENSTNPVQNKVICNQIDLLYDSHRTALDMINLNSSDIEALNNSKVDKVEGKSLSTNDYTTAEKTKLSGIAVGANKTVVDSELNENSINPVQNKVIASKINATDSAVGSMASSLNVAFNRLDEKLPLSGGTMNDDVKIKIPRSSDGRIGILTSGGYKFKIPSNAGFSMGPSWFTDEDLSNNLGGIGAYGTANDISYFYVGGTYNDPLLKVNKSDGSGVFKGSVTATSFNGNASSATKWATARNINGLSVDGSANRVNYGTCSTAAATAAKTVACPGFTLITGAEITVKFTVTNTAASPTLNVNSTGEKSIYYRGAAILAGYLAANHTYTFRYNGTQYELVGDVNTNNYVTQTNTTTSADYRMLFSGNSNDTTETTSSKKSSKFLANPSTGEFYAEGYRRIDISNQTLDVNNFNLSSGAPMIKYYVCKTSGGSDNISNIPVTGGAFLLDVELIRWVSRSDYITMQTFRSVNSKPNEYVRFCVSGTWGSWTTRVFTDTNVTQNNTTAGYDYRLLLSNGPNDNNDTNIARKSTNFYANPSTGVLTSKYFKASSGGAVVYNSNFDEVETADVTITDLFKYGSLLADILIKNGMNGTYIQGIIPIQFVNNGNQYNVRVPGNNTLNDFIAITKSSTTNTITFTTRFDTYSGYGISSIRIISI